jgi:hypothetical protein
VVIRRPREGSPGHYAWGTSPAQKLAQACTLAKMNLTQQEPRNLGQPAEAWGGRILRLPGARNQGVNVRKGNLGSDGKTKENK